jgi:DNA-directed RNA polymerase omega subunit
MAALTQPPESKFAYVILASRRARQLMAGAPPLIDNPRSRKATRVAQEELDRGQLEFEMPERPEGADEKEGKRRKG